MATWKLSLRTRPGRRIWVQRGMPVEAAATATHPVKRVRTEAAAAVVAAVVELARAAAVEAVRRLQQGAPRKALLAELLRQQLVVLQLQRSAEEVGLLLPHLARELLRIRAKEEVGLVVAVCGLRLLRVKKRSARAELWLVVVAAAVAEGIFEAWFSVLIRP